jgi:hypothetical protein
MDGAPRHLVDRVRILFQAGRFQLAHGTEAEETVRRHEDVLHHNGVGTGAAQADDIPHVIDAVVVARDEEAAEIHRLAVLDHRAAEHRPGGVIAAGRPGPRAVDQVAAVDDRARAHWCVGGGDPDFGVLAPDVFLRLLREQREVPVVHAHNARHPAGGPARTGDLAHGVVEDHRIGGVTAPLLGLEQPEEAGLLQRLHAFVGDAPQVLGLLCAFAQRRQQRFDPFGHFLRHLGTCSCLVG